MKKILIIIITIMVNACATKQMDVKVNQLCVIKNSGETRIKGDLA